MGLKKKNKKVETSENSNNSANINSDSTNNTTTDVLIDDENTEQETDKNSDIIEKIAEMQEKYLRLSAEFDNYRKRTLKERAELLKTASEDTLIKILPVVDDFERALKMIDSAKDIESVKSGIFLIYNKFNEFLSQKGVKAIEAKNNEFDTDLHEALTKIPAPSEELKGKVIEEIEKGYYLYDKVIRFSKVVVGE